MDALRNYLAWQGDIGVDEVVLAAPRIDSTARVAVAAPAAGKPADQVAGKSVEATADKPETQAADGLFAMLSQTLAASEGEARAKKAASLGITPALVEAAPRRTAEAVIPAFAGHEEHRAYLEKNMRALHTGEVQGVDWRLVPGAGPDYAPLALVALEPRPADSAAGLPFQGEGGVLLEKMMRAIKLDMSQLYRTLVVKVAGPAKVWTRRDLVRLLPLLHAELALARTPVVLLLGEACAQAVLKTGKSLEELRGAFHRVEGAPDRDFAVTWHPDELEGKEELKRKAWKDLQWLQTRLVGK
jgi:uracil-DNA glycosylase family 4